MKETIARLMRKPWITHILAALDRFLQRLGPQFAGSITYFSILSMVPVLLFGIAVLGFVVTVVRPDLLQEVLNLLQEQLGAVPVPEDSNDDTSSLVEEIGNFVSDTFNGWRSYGPVSLAIAAYSGTRWVRHLKHAVRAMWKDTFAEAAKRGSFLGELFGNLVIFLGLLLSIAVAVAVTAAGQAFPEEIILWLGAEDIPGITTLISAASLVVSLLASWLLFAFLFLVLPGEPTKPRTFIKGTLAGAVLVTALQRVAGVLVELFSGNRAAGVIGPIIIVMLVFNVLATIILMISAWVGTAETWQAERAVKDAREAAGVEDANEIDLDKQSRHHKELMGVTAPTAAARLRAERWAAELDPDRLRAVNYDPATVHVEDPEALVKQGVAARSVRMGMRVGYSVGAATGVGLGAVITALLGKFSRR